MAIRKDFGFIGRLCLDFAQTGDMGFGTRFERLTTPSELQRWMSLSPFDFPRVPISFADLNSARNLRSSIWRIAVAILARKSPAVSDLRLLNHAACKPGLVRKLNRAAKARSWHLPTIHQALAIIAQDAVALFGVPSEKKRMHRCNNPRCITIFYDDSRPGLRRWCAPNRCGDRIRAKAYRDRHRP